MTDVELAKAVFCAAVAAITLVLVIGVEVLVLLMIGGSGSRR